MKVRSVLATALLAGVALLTLPVPAAGQQQGMVPPGETEAERIARETIAAIRASEQGTLTTSLAPLTPAQRQRLAVAGPMTGRWTTCALPAGFNPVHASVLPDGTVLLMAGSGNNTADFAAGRFRSYIFSPGTCTTYPLPTPGDLFCAGHAGLPNGNVLIAGGTRQYDPFQGLRTSYEYDWVNRRFVRLPLMPAAAAGTRGPHNSAAVTCSCCLASTARARSTPSPRSTATAVAAGAPPPTG